MKVEKSQSEIADLIGVHKSTILRRVVRNSALRGYRPQQAQRFYQQRSEQKITPRIEVSTRANVERLLRADCSPKQISLLRKVAIQRLLHTWSDTHQVSIDDRLSIVDTRSRLGDWELDTAIGKIINKH